MFGILYKLKEDCLTYIFMIHAASNGRFQLLQNATWSVLAWKITLTAIMSIDTFL
jgi:hypothetical protein